MSSTRCMHTDQMYTPTYTDTHIWPHIPHIHWALTQTQTEPMAGSYSPLWLSRTEVSWVRIDIMWIPPLAAPGFQSPQLLAPGHMSTWGHRSTPVAGTYSPAALLQDSQYSLSLPIMEFLPWNSPGRGPDKVSGLLRTLDFHLPLCLCTSFSLCGWAFEGLMAPVQMGLGLTWQGYLSSPSCHRLCAHLWTNRPAFII